MPCHGPNEEQSRTMEHGQKLCKLIIGLNHMSGAKILTGEELDLISTYSDGYMKWNYKRDWFDKLTALLCKKIEDLTEEEKDKYLYDGKNSTSRKLADWWEKHQELDRERLIEEIEKEANYIAEKESRILEDEIFNREYNRLMNEKDISV